MNIEEHFESSAGARNRLLTRKIHGVACLHTFPFDRKTAPAPKTCGVESLPSSIRTLHGLVSGISNALHMKESGEWAPSSHSHLLLADGAEGRAGRTFTRALRLQLTVKVVLTKRAGAWAEGDIFPARR